MQKQRLREYNLERYGSLYTKMINKYKKLTNLGSYKRLGFNIVDMIGDAYLAFTKNNPPETCELEDEHLENRFNKFVYWQSRQAVSTHSWDYKLHKKLITGDDVFKLYIFDTDDSSYDLDIDIDMSEYPILRKISEGYKMTEIAKQEGSYPVMIRNRKLKEQENFIEKYHEYTDSFLGTT